VNEWNPDPDFSAKEKTGPVQRESLFPKSQTKREPSDSALQDSNELQTLFANPQLRNSKSFKEIIEQNREVLSQKDESYRKAGKILGYPQQTKHVIVGDVTAVQAGKGGLLQQSATTMIGGSSYKFLGTPKGGS